MLIYCSKKFKIYYQNWHVLKVSVRYKISDWICIGHCHWICVPMQRNDHSQIHCNNRNCDAIDFIFLSKRFERWIENNQIYSFKRQWKTKNMPEESIRWKVVSIRSISFGYHTVICIFWFFFLVLKRIISFNPFSYFSRLARNLSKLFQNVLTMIFLYIIVGICDILLVIHMKLVV